MAKKLGFPDLEQPLIKLAKHGLVQDHEVVEEAIAFDERVRNLSETWGSTLLQKLTLTSVGIAIGHTYWRRVTGGFCTTQRGCEGRRAAALSTRDSKKTRLRLGISACRWRPVWLQQAPLPEARDPHASRPRFGLVRQLPALRLSCWV